MQINYLISYQTTIIKIADVLYHAFNTDVALYFKMPSEKNYSYPKKNNFLYTKKLPKILKNKLQQDYVELRFLCQSQNHSEIKTGLKKIQLCIIPYSHEDFYNASFVYEFNIKIYPEDAILEIITDKINNNIENISIEIKNLLQKNKVEDLYPEKDINSRNIILPEKLIKELIANLQYHMRKGDCYLANATYTTVDQANYQQKFMQYKDFIKLWFKIKPRYGIYLLKPQLGLACFSPERFLLSHNNFLLSEPIKGTLAHDNALEKKEYVHKLWQNRKEIYEHTLIVDLMRHDLNSVCLAGSVKVYQPFQIYITNKLLQMQSIIFGKKDKKFTITDCFTKLLPVASVTGTPKKKVCELIARYEKTTRGFYTGICSLIERDEDFDSCVLIRSLYLGKKGIYVGVGAGITTLSNIDHEIDEFYQKLNSFRTC